MRMKMLLSRTARTLLAGVAVSLAAVGIAPVAQAADLETIEGTVTWANGTPAAGVSVGYFSVSCDSDHVWAEPWHAASTVVQADGSFWFGTYAGACYSVGFGIDGNPLELSVGGSPIGRNAYPSSGTTGLTFQATNNPPVSISVTVPDWTPSAAESDLAIFRQYVDASDGQPYWEHMKWAQVPSSGQFTVDLLPGATYTAMLQGDEHYYDQYAGGADAGSTWQDPPADVQKLTISTAGTPSTWSPIFKRGSSVTGKVSLDGEQPADVQVNLVDTDSVGNWKNRSWSVVAADGAFSFGGLIPGQSYTLSVTSDKHVETWLGGYAGESPQPNMIKSSAFQATAAGGTVSGKNIALTAKAGFIRGTRSFDYSEFSATNAVSGDVYSFNHVDLNGPDVVDRANVVPGIYLVTFTGETWISASDSIRQTGSQIVAISAGAAVTPTFTNRNYDEADAGTTAITLSGTAKVGSTLTAAATTNSAAATPSYAFYWTDGVSILGTGQAYTPKAADLGKVLNAFVVVTVAGAVDDIATIATAKITAAGSTSTPTPIPTTPKPTPTTPNPTVPPPASDPLTLDTGNSAPRVGQIVPAPAVPAGWTAAYQWLSNGQPIPGATGPTYKLTGRDAGKRIQVRLTLTRPGATTVTRTTKSVTVAKIIPTVKAKLLKSGKLRVTVKAKGITKPTGKIKVKFGKVTKTYKLKAKAKGKLTVTIPKKVKAGRIKVKATFKGTAQIAKKTAKTIKITIKR